MSYRAVILLAFAFLIGAVLYEWGPVTSVDKLRPTQSHGFSKDIASQLESMGKKPPKPTLDQDQLRRDLAYEVYASHDRFDPRRKLSLQLRMPVHHFRTEARDELSATSYWEAAIPRFAARECAFLIESFASECTVLVAVGRRIENRAQVAVRIELVFQEQSELGAWQARDPSQFEIVEHDIATADAGEPGRTDQSRQVIYERISAACEALRQNEGTCSMLGIDLSQNDAGNGTIETKGTAFFGHIPAEAVGTN